MGDNNTDIHRIDICSTQVSRVRFLYEEDTNYQQVSTPSPSHQRRRRRRTNEQNSNEKGNHQQNDTMTLLLSSHSSSNSSSDDDVQVHSMESTSEANRDMKRLTNYFYDERLEESYQLYSSTCDLPVARKIILFLFFYEMTMYLMFLYAKKNCTAMNTSSSKFIIGGDMENNNASINGLTIFTSTLSTTKDVDDLVAKCITTPVHIQIDKSYDYILWAFGPFAILFSTFPMKWLEGTMRLRIGVYYFRRRWKRVASFTALLNTIGANIYVMKCLALLKEAYQQKLKSELFCASGNPLPDDIFIPPEFRPNDPMTLVDWIILYEMEFAGCMSMSVIALFVTVAGIVAVSLKVDFPHVLFNCFSLATTIILMIAAQDLVFNSQSVHRMMSHRLLYLLCTIIPMGFTLMATYMEDRASRMAYVSRMRAERMNTTLKLDLSVKQVGLGNLNRSITKDEQEAMEDALLHADDTALLKDVAIPFADLELKELLTTRHDGILEDLLLADYHGTQVVLKRLPASSCTRQGLKDFKTRVELFACLRHPNIVQFIGATYDNLANVGIVMEYLEKGDVFSLLRSNMALTWNDPLLKIATDVAQGVSYLHNCDPPLVHRDLKSSNLLCTTTYSCKVSDFGESKRQSAVQLLSTIVGTPYWLAPEILREEKYDAKVDCYSFGIVMMELETRKDPYYEFKDLNTIDIMMRVARGELRPTIPSTCTESRRHLIVRCLDPDPKKRPKMTEILYSLQHEVREEVVGNVLENAGDKRRVLLLQRHQMLNRRGVKDLLLRPTQTQEEEE